MANTATPTTTTTTTPSSGLTPANQALLKKLLAIPVAKRTTEQNNEIGVLQNPQNGNPLGGYGGIKTGAGTQSPYVSALKGDDIVNFSLPNQTTPFGTNLETTTTTGTGATAQVQMSLNDWMNQIAKVDGDKTTVDQIQTLLKASGYLKGSYSAGTLDTKTKTAWQALGEASVNSPFSAMTLLYAGNQAPLMLQDYQDTMNKISSLQTAAANASVTNVTLTDPNKTAQTFATAMESMGEGAPSQAKTDAFVKAFHDAEIAASENQVGAQRAGDASSAAALQSQLTTLETGGTAAYDALNNGNGIVGPVSVATKAAPSLDEEAIAAAQNADPATYYANDMTYGYSLLQRMLGGDLSLPSTPSSPTSQTTSGAIVSSPVTAGG